MDVRTALKLENEDLRKQIAAADKLAERLRALRAFAGEMELRGEDDVIGCKLWTAEDEATLNEYDALKPLPFTEPDPRPVTREEMRGQGL